MKKKASQAFKNIPLLSSNLRSLRNSVRNFKYSRQNRKERSSRIRKETIKILKDKSGGKNVILIVVDCLRADHLSNSGYSRKTTPFLDSIVKKSIFSKQHYTPAPWTYPSVLSLLTGLYPENHGGEIKSNKIKHFNRPDVPNKIHQNVVTLPDILTQIDYQTHYLSAILTADLSTRGLFEKNYCQVKFSAEEIFKKVKKVLKKRKDRNFFYLQLGDLHEKIVLPQEYLKMWGGVDLSLNKIQNWDYRFKGDSKKEGFERYKEQRIKLYDLALRYVDDQLRDFFNFLKKEDLLEESIIVITSDHGEEFWDHVELEEKLFEDPRNIYGVGHGHSLFEEVLRIPLIIHEGSRKRIEAPSSHIDIVPTVLELLELKTELKFDGLNLLDQLEKRILHFGNIGYGYEQKAVLDHPWKLINCQKSNWKLASNLEKDPQEKKNIYDQLDPKVKDGLEKEGKSLWRESDEKDKDKQKVDEITRQRLAKLGYM